ncbi:MAG: type II toxin-antitoxin system RelE/ParE family toxin [Bacteroidales bacterium]|nr:MAG: type II toxin-antitoxin system RelE/ParE family toxin [Bacteroidales bacterium]
MPKLLIWAPLAENDFKNILEYLYREWDEKVTNQFINLTDKLLEHISNIPRQFPIINKKKRIRKCVLTKHNTLFYRVR